MKNMEKIKKALIEGYSEKVNSLSVNELYRFLVDKHGTEANTFSCSMCKQLFGAAGCLEEEDPFRIGEESDECADRFAKFAEMETG